MPFDGKRMFYGGSTIMVDPRRTDSAATCRVRRAMVEGTAERDPETRCDTWDLLLARTGAPGAHFEDHVAFRQGLRLPGVVTHVTQLGRALHC